MSACRIGYLIIMDRLLAEGAQPDIQMKVCGVLSIAYVHRFCNVIKAAFSFHPRTARLH